MLDQAGQFSTPTTPTTTFEIESQKGGHVFSQGQGFPPDYVFKVKMTSPDELPFAQPAPIGLVGFSVPTLLFAFYTFGWGEPGFVYYLFFIGFFLGGLLQFTAAIFEALAQNLLAFTGFGIFSCFYFGVSSLYFLGFANPALLTAISPNVARYSQLMAFLIFAFIALVLAIAGVLSRNAFTVRSRVETMVANI